MYNFSNHSESQIAIAHPAIQMMFREEIKRSDFRVDKTGRSAIDQQQEYEEGDSTIPGFKPDGSINEFPHMVKEDGLAYAFDVWPYLEGKRLAVPSMSRLALMASRDKQSFIDAVGAWAQFAWFIRGMKETGDRVLKELEMDADWFFRWGLNWDGDAIILTDQTFDDCPHGELRKRS